MAIMDGLVVTVFLILMAASIAVVGSLIALALSDVLMSRKPQSDVTKEVIEADRGPAESLSLEDAMSNWRRERDVTDV
jgi:hypothetical protein